MIELICELKTKSWSFGLEFTNYSRLLSLLYIHPSISSNGITASASPFPCVAPIRPIFATDARHVSSHSATSAHAVVDFDRLLFPPPTPQ